MVSSRTIEHKRRNGFVNTYTDTGTIAAGETITIRIGNPSDSVAPYTVFTISGSTRSAATLDVFGNVTIDTSGTALTAENRFIGEEIDDTLTVEEGVTFSGGTRIAADVFGSQGSNTSGGTRESQGFILDIGSEAVLELTNDGSSSSKYAIYISAYQS